MKKKNTNRLTKLIFGELVCLAVVCTAVFALVRWSARAEGDSGSSADGRRVTMEGAPTGGAEQESGGENIPDDGMPSPTAAEAGNALPQEPGEPTAAAPSGGEDVTQETGGNTAQEPEDASQPTLTAAPKPTAADTPKPTATTAPKPTATTAPKPTATTAPKPTSAPKPTDAPKPTGSQTGIAEKPGMDMAFINSLSAPQSGEKLTADGAVDTVYYLQTDSRWGSKFYGGEDTIAKYGCGPTSMAIVVSSLTEIGIDPEQMSGWANANGYWYPQSGSLHSVVNGTAKAFGLESEGVGNDGSTEKKVKDALKNGDMAVVLMGKGHFTKSGHFIVLRGITSEGKILVADCNSRDNTLTEWDFETIRSEAKWASDGGPFWIIRNPNTIK